MNPALEQLKDIHLPAAVSWWPLSLFTFLMLGLAVILIAACVFLCLYSYRRRALLRASKKELTNINEQSIDDSTYLNNIAVLIRRHAICKNAQLSSLHGQLWQQHLQAYMTEDTAKLLAITRYQKIAPIERKVLSNAALRYIQGRRL